jgi:hypothetical protein
MSARGGSRIGAGRKKKDVSEKYVFKAIRFRPEYAAQITQFAKQRNVSQRELIEECLKEVLGVPESIKKSG